MATNEQQLVLLEPQAEDEKQPELSGYALVEIFGHVRIVGWLTQQAFGSAVLFRIDVPDMTQDGKVVRKGFTRYFGVGSIYSITPIDAETMKELLPSISGAPARPYSISSSSSRYDEDKDY